jgi:hypothetical protein
MKRATRAAFNLEDEDQMKILRQKIEDEELGIGLGLLLLFQI